MRTITVKGTGRVTARPDCVEISLSRETHKLDYDKAVETANERMEAVTSALTAVGFRKEDLKTTSYHIRSDYISVQNRVRGQERQFNGYVVEHRMKLVFPLDKERLSSALGALSGCISHPEFDIRFFVKDTAALQDAILKDAAANARRTAEILCAASGVQLGELQNISYHWDEVSFYSPTSYSMAEESMVPRAMRAAADIEPDDIQAGDTVTFVWEIR